MSGERSYDIYSRLLKERIVLVHGEIDDKAADVVTAQLLFCQFENKNKEVRLYVNSPGGSVTASLAIHDTMKFVECPIATYAIGEASGTALLLVTAGTRGSRFGLPHARFSFADIWGGPVGSTAELAIQKDEIARLERAIFELYAANTGQPYAGIEKAHGTGKSYSAEEALELGFIDRIVDDVERVAK